LSNEYYFAISVLRDVIIFQYVIKDLWKVSASKQANSKKGLTINLFNEIPFMFSNTNQLMSFKTINSVER